MLSGDFIDLPPALAGGSHLMVGSKPASAGLLVVSSNLVQPVKWFKP